MSKEGDEQTATGEEDVASKAIAASALEIALSLSLDRELRATGMAIVALCLPCQRWHSEQNCANRSGQESCA
eukprot:1191834-Amphidinium_carterae.1